MSRELSIGMITGFITLAWMTLGYSLNWDQSEMGKYAPIISLLILIGGIYITILQKRDKDKGGIISFKEAWFAGVAVSFVVGIMSGAYMAVYVKYVNPGMVNEVIKTATDFYKSQKDSQEQIDKAVESIKAMYSGFGQFTYGIGTTMLTGMVISLVCAAIMKRSEKLKMNH